MERKFTLTLVLGTALMLALGLVSVAMAQGPEGGPKGVTGALSNGFTYQGRLVKSGTSVNASCDLTFSLWTGPSNGSQIGGPQTQFLVVRNGLFTSAPIDFGAGAFQGDARYLQIAVQCPDDTSATTLSRQALTPAPYALALPGLYTTQNVTSSNVIGGYRGNLIDESIYGATIGGGGEPNSGGLVFVNHVSGNHATVSGGKGNTAGLEATVGGGIWNTASNIHATVGGGISNSAPGDAATIGGGAGNIASGQGAFVGGGGFDGTDWFANVAQGNASAIGGGISNTVTADYGSVVGGTHNTASGFGSTVGGGTFNVAAGEDSFVAGHRAKNSDTGHNGVFLFADANDFDFTSFDANEFAVRSTGGVRFVTGIDGSGNPNAGTNLPPGSGTWSSPSDRNSKANLAPVDGRAVLDQVVKMPVETWNYKTQDPSIRHMGPMAQDFYAAFRLGEDDKHIDTIDADGVALAAIQGMHQTLQEELQARDAQITALQEENAALVARLAALEQVAKTNNVPGHTDMLVLAFAGLVGVVTFRQVRRGGGQ